MAYDVMNWNVYALGGGLFIFRLRLYIRCRSLNQIIYKQLRTRMLNKEKRTKSNKQMEVKRMGRKSKKIIAILLSMLMVFSVCSPITGGAGLGSTSAKAGAEARTATASDADVRLYGAMRASGDKYDLSSYLDSVTVGKKKSA